MATSLVVPVAYITILLTGLAVFSRIYRRRRLAEKTSFEPWFPSHPQRDTYITLLSLDPPPPDSLIKSALLVRAAADVKRIWRIRDDKMALTNLHGRGLIGDDTMARFAAAEKELEAEIVDVVQEANTFRQGWGGMIFQTATEMAQAEKTRDMVMSINKIRTEENRKLVLRKKYLPDTVIPPPFQIPAAAMAQLAQAQAQAQALGGAQAAASPAKLATQTAAAAAITPQSQEASSAKVSTGNGSGQGSGASTPMDMEGSGELVSTPSKAPGDGQATSNVTPSKSSAKKKKGKK